jgi:hypothetical protein
MKNLFLINEDERNRILNLHETATKNQYLTEQSDELTKSAKRIAAKMAKAAVGMGTDEDAIVAAIQEIKDGNMFNLVNGLIPAYGMGEYITIVNILNGEFGTDDLSYVEQIYNHLKSIGITMTYQDDVDSSGNDIFKENSIKITVPKVTPAPAASKSAEETFKNFPCVPTLANKKRIKMESNGSFVIGNFRYFGNGRKGDITTKQVLNYTCNDKEFKTAASSGATAGTTKPKASVPTDADLDKYLTS